MACNLQATGTGNTREGERGAAGDIPELAPFGELASVHPDPISTDVGPEASLVDLYDGASLQIPAGAFPAANRLQVTRVDVAFDQIAPDVSAGLFYVVVTRDDVPALGAPIILELPGSAGDVAVVRYEGDGWVPVPVEPGAPLHIRIDHFSKGIFGFFEWWSERDVELGETIDSMDNNSAPARTRIAIEGGDQNVHSFFGVNEQSNQTDTEICAEITAMLQQYNHPGNREFPYTAGSTTDLADFLFAGSAPSQVGGPYWSLTENSMEAINDRLLANESQVGPAEFLRIAIEANNGNIPRGILAAHNYLKDITYLGRKAYSPSTGMPPEYGGPASRLASWRQGSNITAAGEYDKMGPLYHIFAAMTGALWLPTRASGPAIASGEAFLRTFRVGGDRPDTSKAAADQCGIDVAAWLRNHPPEDETTPTETRPSPSGQVITRTGTVVPVGLNPGTRVTENSISITYRDDGAGEVTGSAKYATFYLWESCNLELPSSTRWELTGQFDPVSGDFSGTIQEYDQGQITYTDCSVGDVPEYLNGDGGSWEATLINGVITGSITLTQAGGTPLLRVTFEVR